uniref:Uncharacterized protein n=1 Tax=Cacopsylla melanoneura TaxID=428564 RepID=A0A8D9FBZ5_9HEMI
MWHCKHFDNISFGKLSIAQINSVVCLKIILKYFTDRLHIDSTFLFTLIQTQAHHPWYCEFGNFITKIVRQTNIGLHIQKYWVHQLEKETCIKRCRVLKGVGVCTVGRYPTY